jgi:HK97 gp10 family phage protein
MARGRTTRVKLNRAAIDGVRLAIADGTHAVAKAIVTTANPPDATPFGEGLITRGGTLAYVGSKKVDGWSLDGRQPRKPRKLRVKGTDTIVAVAGFGFPGRFQEFGTAHHPAQPFLTPARNQVVPRAVGIMRQATAYRLARLRILGRA